jgi:hypothetical protein
VTGESTTSVAEPLLDLEHLVVGIRWRRRIWLSLALLGLFIGVLLTVLFPPQPAAVTRVLIARADDLQAERSVLMATDVALCQTSEVAAPALKQLNVTEKPADFLATYHCVGVTPNVLEITVPGRSDADAVRRAQALADAFIANHVTRTQDAVDAEVKPLLDRRARLERTLATINNTISTTTAPAQLDELYSDRESLASQIRELEKGVEEARVGAPAVTAGTRLVDPPRALPLGLIRTGITQAVMGLVLGLGAGLAVAALLSVSRDRPVLRRDIAAQLGVSIIAQLPELPRGPCRVCRRSRHTRERKRVAATLARLVRDTPSSVSLLEIGCPQTTAALALDIAIQLASERPVVIVDDLDGSHLRKVGRDDSPVQIIDIAELSVGQPSSTRRPELYLGVGSVGPGRSCVDKERLGLETVLVVRAGQATTLWLHTVARHLAQSEISAIGAVLVAPDPRDRSDGTLWDGLHMILRERMPPGAAPSPGRPPISSANGKHVLEPSSVSNEVRK